MKDYDVRYHRNLDKIHRRAQRDLTILAALVLAGEVVLWGLGGSIAELCVIGATLAIWVAFILYENSQHRRYKRF
jgi:hypothetical protein